MNKLFAPLNEQIEVVRIKNTPIDQKLYDTVSNDIIFNNNLNDIIEHKLEEEFLNQYCDYLLFEEFKAFLNEDPLILDEETLNEGAILNKIRWKLSLFTLRFLSNTSIDAFFIAYYADKNTGQPTEKGKEFCRKPRKEKLAKMRELANNMKDEDKQKVINSQAAKNAERSGIVSFAVAGAAGAVAGISGYAASKGNAAKSTGSEGTVKLQTHQQMRGNEVIDDGIRDVPCYYDDKGQAYITATEYTRGPNFNTTFTENKVKKNIYISSIQNGTFAKQGAHYSVMNSDGKSFALDSYTKVLQVNKVANVAVGIFTMLSSLLFGVMWGSIILAGVSAARGVLQFHKANTIRRDEIMDELKSKMDPKVAKQLAKQYKQERKQEKKNNH